MTIIPLCFNCRHFDASEPRERRCTAFPRGIPRPILDSEVDHTKPYVGDQGIRFERDPDRTFTPDPSPDLSGFDF